MKQKRYFPILAACALFFALMFSASEKVSAAEKTNSISKSLVYQKSLDISLGKGGVYFPSSAYTGTVVLTRIEPIPTKDLTFTQRWIDIHLFESTNKEFKIVFGYVYVYFNLNVEDRAAWEKGKLSIFHYRQDKKIWEECETRLIADASAPYGRVRFLITEEYGQYGLGLKR
jgi:hypothetical protein